MARKIFTGANRKIAADTLPKRKAAAWEKGGDAYSERRRMYMSARRSRSERVRQME